MHTETRRYAERAEAEVGKKLQQGGNPIKEIHSKMGQISLK